MSGNLTIRPLTEDDWQILRETRLAALRETPGNYCADLSQTEAKPEQEWRDQLNNPNACAFGLFDGAALVGITGVFLNRDDPNNGYAYLGMSHITPSHRGKGLAAMLYQARLDWALSRPQVKRIKVSTRADNMASRKGMERAGFVEVDRAPRDWPDGITTDELIYELDLAPLRASKQPDQKP
ncbi:MAG: GNAT family N-acetyltransferase [Alphaproteobacteria bacterium]